jgi:hypothetical protein
MYQDDYDNYDDYDDYDSHEDYDSQSNNWDKNKFYFKFDPQIWDTWMEKWGEWFKDALGGIVESSPNTWYISSIPNTFVPVNGYNPIYEGGKKVSSYIGNNQYNEEVWKTQDFVVNELSKMYKNHLVSNAKHFVQQPNYYKGMFDILN